jgi:uncharacterized membrane protein|tara:strand:- start:386 stop:592 length:207 start_codon:yes stop_codon:yes gene_type:complete
MSEGIFDPSVSIDSLTDVLSIPISDVVSSELYGTELSSDIFSILSVLLLLIIIFFSYTYNRKETYVED